MDGFLLCFGENGTDDIPISSVLIILFVSLQPVTATGHFRSPLSTFLMSDDDSLRSQPDPLLVLLPLLIVLSTFLFLLLSFLICAVILRRRRGIILRDNDGPVDMSREDLIEGDGGFSNIESRWLEESNENLRRAYLRAKGAFFSALPRTGRSFVYNPRVPSTIPSKLSTNRHYPFAVPLNTGKGCVRVVF